MTLPLTIRLPGVPKGKGRPRFVKATGRTYTPEATRSYEGMLRLAGANEMGQRAPLEGALIVSVVAEMPIPTSWPKKKQEAARIGAIKPTGKPDVDNLLKTLDALNEVVWRDDAQISEAIVRKLYSDKPCLTVTVWRPMEG